MTEAGLIRVSHILWSGAMGGIERLVHDLAVEQTRAGHQVGVVFGQAEGPFADLLRERGIAVTDLGLRSGWALPPRRIASGREVLGRASVVHMHGFNFAFAAMLSDPKPAILYTEHGHFALGRRLGLGGRAKRQVLKSFLRRRVDLLAANSAHTASRMCDLYGIDRDVVAVVHNGIASEPQDRPADARVNGRLTVAFLGRLVPFKRVDRLIRAVSLMEDPSAIRALIAGSGPLEAELLALARRLGVEKAISFVGRVDDVSAMLARVDVIVQPSEAEPFGIALVEGCREGCLPIAFADGGGALEVIPPDAIVIEDEHGLADALARLVNSDALSGDARRDRAAWARRQFSISRCANRYADLYRAAIRRRSASMPMTARR